MSRAAGNQQTYTAEEYLRYDDATPGKHELRDGRILAMSGGTINHSLIIANVIRAIGNRLEGSPCRVFDSNLRVRLAPSVRYSYPDATVICGEVATDTIDPSRNTATNPRVVIEVLSDSSERFDRGEKFGKYIRLESLDEYVLVFQDTARVETFVRQENGAWLFAFFEGRDAKLLLRSLDIEVGMSEIYAGVKFSPVPNDADVTGSPTAD